MDLFHNEIISFCLRKATIKLASDLDCSSFYYKVKLRNRLSVFWIWNLILFALDSDLH
jgi:hypothetical protein